MEIDYYQILGLPKFCTKKDISSAYRRALRDQPSPKRRSLLDRALLVLRVCYLRYKFDKHGEAGLREKRSVKTIKRGIKAITAARPTACVTSSSSSSTSSAEISGVAGSEGFSARSQHAPSECPPPMPELGASAVCTAHCDSVQTTLAAASSCTNIATLPLSDPFSKVTAWMEEAWRNGMMPPTASSSITQPRPSVSWLAPGGAGQSNANKPAIVTELFPRCPSPPVLAISSSTKPAGTTVSCWDQKVGGPRQGQTDHNVMFSTRSFITRSQNSRTSCHSRPASPVETVKKPYSKPYSVVSQRGNYLAPPRPILGGRVSDDWYRHHSSISNNHHMSFHPFGMSHREPRFHPYLTSQSSQEKVSQPWTENCAGPPWSRYHLERPLLHMTRNTATSTLRVLIQR